MASGFTDSYDASVVLKQSLDPVIWDLFPMDTYAISNVDKVSVKNTMHEWVFDKLAAAANNKNAEGADATYATLATATRVSNYTQISRKVVKLTDTYTDGVDTIGQNPMGRAVLKAMKELKRDMEFDYLGGQGSSAGASTLIRATAGVQAWIWGSGATSPNEGNTVAASDATHFTTPAYASAACAGQTLGTTSTSLITLGHLTSAMELAWLDGGEPDTIICSSAQKKYIDAMTSLATRTVDVGRTDKLPILGAANLIVTSYGTYKVVMSRYLGSTAILIMDMNMWALGQLRAPKVVDLAKTGDNTGKLMVAEWCCIARNPNSSAKVIGFAN